MALTLLTPVHAPTAAPATRAKEACSIISQAYALCTDLTVADDATGLLLPTRAAVTQFTMVSGTGIQFALLYPQADRAAGFGTSPVVKFFGIYDWYAQTSAGSPAGQVIATLQDASNNKTWTLAATASDPTMVIGGVTYAMTFPIQVDCLAARYVVPSVLTAGVGGATALAAGNHFLVGMLV